MYRMQGPNLSGAANGFPHPGPLPAGEGVWIPAFAEMTGGWRK